MRLKKNNQQKRAGRKINTPDMDPVEMNKDMQKIMEEWQARQQQEKEELAAQTWPIWLLPEYFEKWYRSEQKNRSDKGMIPLPDPPLDVIQKVFVENNKDR